MDVYDGCVHIGEERKSDTIPQELLVDHYSIIGLEEICIALGCPDIIVCFIRHDNAFRWYSRFCLCGTSGKY